MSFTLGDVIRLKLACLYILLGLTTACGAVQRPDGGRGLLTAGAAVKPLQGRDQHGQVVVLKYPTPQPTVVYFYPKDSTPGCTKEACAFRDVWRKYQQRGLTVIGVSSDSVESHLGFAREHQLPFALIADETGDWGRTFGVPSVAGFYSRVTFLVGQDGRVLKTYEDVDPGLHANQILLDAAALSPSSTPSASTVPSPGIVTGSELLAPAPRLNPEPPPTVSLVLQLGVSPNADIEPRMWLAAELTPPPGAHLSWKHAGETGLPTAIEFFGPVGFDVGPVQYPAPERFQTGTGRETLGYTGPIVVLAEVTANAGARIPMASHPETYALFQVHGTWLSCDKRCVKEDVNQSLKWNGARIPLPELPQWLTRLPEGRVPIGFSAKLIRKSNTIALSTPAKWQIEDAFLEADVAPGGRLPTFTRSAASGAVIGPIPEPAPAEVLLKAQSPGTGSRHFRVSVTDE